MALLLSACCSQVEGSSWIEHEEWPEPRKAPKNWSSRSRSSAARPKEASVSQSPVHRSFHGDRFVVDATTAAAAAGGAADDDGGYGHTYDFDTQEANLNRNLATSQGLARRTRDAGPAALYAHEADIELLPPAQHLKEGSWSWLLPVLCPSGPPPRVQVRVRGNGPEPSQPRHLGKGSGKGKGGGKGSSLLEQDPTGRSRPNFTGEWLCSRFEGDMEGLMVGLEATWAQRQAAYIVSYGVGYAGRNIIQQGDHLVIGVDAPPASFVQRFRVGGGRQLTEGPEGPALVTPRWEPDGRGLVFLQQRADCTLPVLVRQFLDGQDLVVEMTAPNRATAWWIFQRQS